MTKQPKFFEVRNDWERRTYYLNGVKIDPYDIKYIIINGQICAVKAQSKSVSYSDHGHTYYTETDVLLVYVGVLDEWIEMPASAYSKVTSIQMIEHNITSNTVIYNKKVEQF